MELSGRASQLQHYAEEEFKSLNEYTKLQAIAKLGKLVAEVPKIPEFMKTAAKEIEKELLDVKELQQELSKESVVLKLGEDGKICAAAQKIKPTDCYTLIYGSITGTTKET